MKQKDLALRLDVSQGRLSNWERGEHDPPPEVVLKVVSILKKPLPYFYQDDIESLEIAEKTAQNRQTSVYYNPVDDSGPDADLLNAAEAVADLRTIRITVPVGEGSRIWSAKGAQRDTLHVYAFLATGRKIVKLGGDSLVQQFHPGTVLVFESDDYPTPDTFLYLSHKADPDLRTIRFVDSEREPDRLYGFGDEPAERLSEWNVEGYAYAEVRSARTGAPEVDIRPAGIRVRKSRKT